MFFILQVTVALAYASDNIVAAQVLRATAVPDYAMPMKLFSLAGIFPTLLFAGLWPAYGEAIARGDIAWIERTLKRTLSTTLVVVGVPAVGLVLFGREILHLWVGDAVRPGFALMAGMGAWCVLSALGNTVAVFLNGANELRAQVLCSLAMAPTAIVLKIVLARMWGLPGIVWAIVFSYVVCTALPLAWLVPHRMRELRRAHRSSPEALGTMAVSRAMEQG
jgi:O-antigen/teichoic acid export membrane protein